MRKVLLLLTALVVVPGILAGCGDKADEVDKAKPDAAAGAPNPGEPKGNPTL